MKIRASGFATGFAITTVFLWTFCSLFVALLPVLATPVTGHMFRINMDGFVWHLTWAGFFVGLVSWTLCAALAGWLIASIYNYLDREITA